MPNYLPGIYLSQESVDALTDILPYTFNDLILLSEAFEAAGSSPAEEGNKRQAHIGDVVLRLVLYLDGRSHNASTAANSMFHDRTANNASLAKAGFLKGLDRFIHLNPSARGHVTDNLMATTVEAVIGAVYLDSGYDIAVARKVIIRLGILEE